MLPGSPAVACPRFPGRFDQPQEDREQSREGGLAAESGGIILHEDFGE
jgi:hypothetical protein